MAWYDGLLPHASSPTIVKAASGSWDDEWVYGAVPFRQSDGTLWRDSSGNVRALYIGTGNITSPGTSEDQTGLLVGSSLATLARHPSNPVLPFGSGTYNDGAWDDTDCQIGAVIESPVTPGLLFAFYCGNNVPGPASDYVRLGLASSTDEGLTWTKYASNPVLSQGGSGAADELDLYTAGGVRYDSDLGQWQWYYIGHSAAGVLRTMLATRSATSPLGTWTKQAALTGISPEGSGGATYSPGITQVWKDAAGTYHALADDWYNLNQAFHYSSADGRAWTKGAQVLAPGSSGAWDDSRCYYPVVCEESLGTLTLIYTGSTSTPVYGIGVVALPGVTGYGNTVSSGYGDATAYQPLVSSLTIDSGSLTWAQVGTDLTVSGVEGVRTATAVDFHSELGGTVRITGTHASRVEVSADGVTWAPTLVIPAGASSGYLSVLPDLGDTLLTFRVGVPR